MTIKLFPCLLNKTFTLLLTKVIGCRVCHAVTYNICVSGLNLQLMIILSISLHAFLFMMTISATCPFIDFVLGEWNFSFYMPLDVLPFIVIEPLLKALNKFMAITTNP